VRSDSAGSRDLPNVELDHAIALIAAAGEHARCGQRWPILRKRGRGCAVATLGFTLAGESKLLLTHWGRSSAHAKSTGRDLPTGFAVGRIHNTCSILSDRDTGDWRPRTCHQSPRPKRMLLIRHRVRLAPGSGSASQRRDWSRHSQPRTVHTPSLPRDVASAVYVVAVSRRCSSACSGDTCQCCAALGRHRRRRADTPRVRPRVRGLKTVEKCMPPDTVI
jgi:hypothetical protein